MVMLSRLAVAVAAAMIVAIAGAGAAFADTVEVRLRSNVRQGPSTQTAILERASVGAQFPLLDDGARIQGFYRVELSSGRHGWIYSARVRRHLDAPSPQTPSPPQPSLAPLGANRMAVHYINVDQGAAALIEFPCAAIMIDAGGRNAASTTHLMNYLSAFFARRTDLNNRIATIFITHTHIDHNRALRRVVQTYDVGGYVHNGGLRGSGAPAANWMANHPNATDQRRAVGDHDVVAHGTNGLSDAIIDAVNCPGVDPSIRVLSGRPEHNPGWTTRAFKNGNNMSLVIRIDYGEASFLFTGDMQDPAIETLVHYYHGTNMLDVDVWEVGHHGAENGVTRSLLQAMSPEIAIMQMGPPSVDEIWTAYRYGHPRRSAVETIDPALSRTRSPAVDEQVADAVHSFSTYRVRNALYATGWDGDITVTADSNGALAVQTGQ